MDQEYYKTLITKELLGEASPEERRLLEDWRNASEGNERLYIQYAKIWRLSPSSEPDAIPDIDTEWQSLRRAMGKNTKRVILPVSRPVSARVVSVLRQRQYWALAAVLVFGLLTSWFLRQESPGSNLNVVYAAAGAEKQVVLPDGSVVRLNSVSELSYSDFVDTAKRVVRVSGEGLFDIKHDGRPFIVETENAQVQVIGTKFNVWAREKKTRVIVQEGRVALSKQESGRSLVLSQNQMGECNDDELSARPLTIDAESRLGWLHGKFVFIRTPFAEVIAELERVFDTSIKLENPQIGTKTMTASFEKKSLAEALDSVCSAMNLAFRKDAEGYIIGE